MEFEKNKIWDEDGNLAPLMPKPQTNNKKDVAVIIVNRNRPDLTDSLVEQVQKMGKDFEVDTYVIEMGSDKDNLSKYCSLHYEDPDFRGKAYGHNVGLRLARSKADYKYYWILMNDLVFDEGQDVIHEMIKILEENSKIALLSPTEYDGACPWSKTEKGKSYHAVGMCDYLSFITRLKIVDDIGFLNPDFKYCWGAMHEYSFKIHSSGMQIAYCDTVTMKHLGGTTYGKAKNTISREEYRKNAKQFASRYFEEHYGANWDEKFNRVLPNNIDYSFSNAKKRWASEDKKLGFFQRLNRKIRKVFLTNQDRQEKQEKQEKQEENDLASKINSLNPWYYEVNIGGILVEPGVGAKQGAESLKSRIEYRTPLLVDEVLKKYDVKGKSMLDLASNCSFWPSVYAQHGAKSLLAVEGRADYVDQGWLYWDNNTFLPKGSYDFLQGNVTDENVWKTIREKGPFDFTLCLGILYHIPNYEDVIKKIAENTREAILIDTRVSENEELITEPGGFSFDAIIETRKKKNPNYNKLVTLLQESGFNVEKLSIDKPTPIGLQGADDYNKGSRVTLLALKK